MKTSLTEVVFGVTRLFKQWKQTSIDLAKIEAAIYYVKGIQALRSLLMMVFILFSSLVMFLMGMIVIHYILLFLIPLSHQARVVTAILLGIMDLALPVYIFWNVFSEKRWMHLSKSDEIVEKVT
jgi:hypothetical protein